MKTMEHIQTKHIILYGIPGHAIDFCLQEAIEVAVREWENVVLIHNDKKYPVFVNALVAVVLEASEKNIDKPEDLIK